MIDRHDFLIIKTKPHENCEFLQFSWAFLAFGVGFSEYFGNLSENKVHFLKKRIPKSVIDIQGVGMIY